MDLRQQILCCEWLLPSYKNDRSERPCIPVRPSTPGCREEAWPFFHTHILFLPVYCSCSSTADHWHLQPVCFYTASLCPIQLSSILHCPPCANNWYHPYHLQN